VFAMAVQIEANGARFYRSAAARCGDAQTAEFLQKMAAMEDGHRKTFEQLRAEAAKHKAAAADLRPEGGLYMAAIADGIRIEGSPSAAEALAGNESVEAMLRLAVDLEKQSVLFYLGLKDVAPAAGAPSVDKIIAEEKAHIATLMAEVLKRQR
jgi:rubrerythrin